LWDSAHGDLLSYHWADVEGVQTEGVRSPLPAPVGPGECVTMPAELRGPARPGPYTLVWQPVREGAKWFGPPAAGEPSAQAAGGPPRDSFALLSLQAPGLQAGLPAKVWLALENRG